MLIKAETDMWEIMLTNDASLIYSYNIDLKLIDKLQ